MEADQTHGGGADAAGVAQPRLGDRVLPALVFATHANVFDRHPLERRNAALDPRFLLVVQPPLLLGRALPTQPAAPTEQGGQCADDRGPQDLEGGAEPLNPRAEGALDGVVKVDIELVADRVEEEAEDIVDGPTEDGCDDREYAAKAVEDRREDEARALVEAREGEAWEAEPAWSGLLERPAVRGALFILECAAVGKGRDNVVDVVVAGAKVVAAAPGAVAANKILDLATREVGLKLSACAGAARGDALIIRLERRRRESKEKGERHSIRPSQTCFGLGKHALLHLLFRSLK